MAPITNTHHQAARLLASSALAYLNRRNNDLKVRGAQSLTLGIIAVYVVGIALLWNIPYVRYVLWPFKVSRVSYLLPPLAYFRTRCLL